MDYAGQTGNYLPIFKDWYISRVTGDSLPRVFELRALATAPIREFNVRRGTFTNVADPVDQYAFVKDIDFEKVTINGVEVSR
jgi:hypothetical protein